MSYDDSRSSNKERMEAAMLKKFSLSKKASGISFGPFFKTRKSSSQNIASRSNHLGDRGPHFLQKKNRFSISPGLPMAAALTVTEIEIKSGYGQIAGINI